MAQKITPFIVTRGNGVEMMNYYHTIFPDSEIINIALYQGLPMAKDGDLLNGHMRIFDLEFYFMDLLDEYNPNKENSENFLIYASSEEEFYQFFNALKDESNVLMGPEPVMDLKLVTWITDKYKMTWQIVYKD